MNPESRARRGAGQPHRDALPRQGHDSTSLDRSEIRALIREELRRMFAVALDVDERTYSTRTGCGPEGYSRESWRAIAHAIGVKRGRYYYVTAAQLAAHEQRDHKPANDAAPTSWHPSEAAAALNLRAVR